MWQEALGALRSPSGAEALISGRWLMEEGQKAGRLVCGDSCGSGVFICMYIFIERERERAREREREYVYMYMYIYTHTHKFMYVPLYMYKKRRVGLDFCKVAETDQRLYATVKYTCIYPGTSTSNLSHIYVYVFMSLSLFIYIYI